jgi:hypothetical protein
LYDVWETATISDFLRRKTDRKEMLQTSRSKNLNRRCTLTDQDKDEDNIKIRLKETEYEGLKCESSRLR